MLHGDVETYHSGGKWRNRIVDGEAVPGVYDSQEVAERVGRTVAEANKTTHITRDVEGQIHERSCYEDDPQDIDG